MRRTAYPDCPCFPTTEQCQHLRRVGPAWLFPQGMMERFDLGSQRNKESCLSRLASSVRMNVVLLPATTYGVVEQVAFRLLRPELVKHGRWCFRDKFGRASRHENRGFDRRGCVYPEDYQQMCLDYRNYKTHLPRIPIPPDLCLHTNDLVTREAVPHHVFVYKKLAVHQRDSPLPCGRLERPHVQEIGYKHCHAGLQARHAIRFSAGRGACAAHSQALTVASLQACRNHSRRVPSRSERA